MRLVCLVLLCSPLLANALDLTTPGRAGLDSSLEFQIPESLDLLACETLVASDVDTGRYDNYAYLNA